MKKLISAIIVLLAMGATTFWWFSRQTNLIDLQKDYLFAKSDTEREKVLDRVEEYYLNLSIPDSIRQRVAGEVSTLLDTTEINIAHFKPQHWDTTNVYELEESLTRLLNEAMIACAQQKYQPFQELMNLIKSTALRIDQVTGVEYWIPFANEVSHFDRTQAERWLKAKKAEELCYLNHNSSKYWQDGEKFGALGLQLLENSVDVRLRLDLMQRMQVILFLFRGLNDLSTALAERYSKMADGINYILRATGMKYHQGEALYGSGQIESALKLFQKCKADAISHHRISSMSWYEEHALQKTADSFNQIGQYDKALEVCQTLEKNELSANVKSLLHNARAMAYQGLGDYESAESEFKKAIDFAKFADFTPNEVTYLHNLGYMFFELSEYDKAVDYYHQAKSLLEKTNPEDLEERINLLIDLANVMVKKNHFEGVAGLVDEANLLISDLGNEWLKCDLLLTVARFHSQNGRYRDALEKLEEAEFICDSNSLIRLGLRIKIELVKNLINLDNLVRARNKVIEIHDTAEHIDDAERFIDSKALLGEIEGREGNVERAVAISTDLIYKIEELSSQFTSFRRLTSFRQKTYDYLKNAVVYELKNNRIDSAYVKLDYAKARSMKKQTHHGNGYFESKAGVFQFINIDTMQARLDENSIVIEYLVTPDMLYVFVLNKKTLQVFKRPIKIEHMQETVNAYKSSIGRTIDVLQKYDGQLIQAQFDSTTRLSQKLFAQLLGWPTLVSLIESNKVIYIIPDEFLYDLPFATLVIRNASESTFLVEKASIITLPGISFIKSAKKKVTGSLSNNSVLISADPSFPGSKNFVKFIKRGFSSVTELSVDKTQFDKSDVLLKLNEVYDIYIFLGHGESNSLNPELSYVELSPINKKTSDVEKMRVTLSDLRRVNWNRAKMVMLIGCETGSGKLYRGTGILGLQLGFISLGVQNVLATLWKVDSGQTIRQMQSFIEKWHNGLQPSLAISQVQMQSINSLYQDKYYQKPHPYLWGSYLLSSIAN